MADGRGPGRPAGSTNEKAPDPGGTESFHGSGECLRLFNALRDKTKWSKGKLIFEALKALAPQHLSASEVEETKRKPSEGSLQA